MLGLPKCQVNVPGLEDDGRKSFKGPRIGKNQCPATLDHGRHAPAPPPAKPLGYLRFLPLSSAKTLLRALLKSVNKSS